jgi:hypothetical protein
MIQEKHTPQLSSVSLATSRRHVLTDFAFNRIVQTNQPHSIFGATLTSLDFGAKKIHKIHRAFDPDTGFSSPMATHPSSGHQSFKVRPLYQPWKLSISLCLPECAYFFIYDAFMKTSAPISRTA